MSPSWLPGVGPSPHPTNPTEKLWCEHISNQSVNVLQNLHPRFHAIEVVMPSFRSFDKVQVAIFGHVAKCMTLATNIHRKREVSHEKSKRHLKVLELMQKTVHPASVTKLQQGEHKPISAHFQPPQSWIPMKFLISSFRIWVSAANHISKRTIKLHHMGVSKK